MEPSSGLPKSSPKLMYRPPGRGYKTLPEALDEIYMRLDKIEGYLKREGAPGKMFPDKRNFFLQLFTLWR